MGGARREVRVCVLGGGSASEVGAAEAASPERLVEGAVVAAVGKNDRDACVDGDGIDLLAQLHLVGHRQGVLLGNVEVPGPCSGMGFEQPYPRTKQRERRADLLGSAA